MQHPSQQSPEPQPWQHPDSAALRQRAADLRRLASSIERSLVMLLGEASDPDTWNTRRARLCDRMLAHNLHQLHEAADDLRESALTFCNRADELDLADRSDVA